MKKPQPTLKSSGRESNLSMPAVALLRRLGDVWVVAAGFFMRPSDRVAGFDFQNHYWRNSYFPSTAKNNPDIDVDKAAANRSILMRLTFRDPRSMSLT